MPDTNFANIAMAALPGFYLNTRRDGDAMQVKLILGSAKCSRM
jgi:hypothetical protein